MAGLAGRGPSVIPVWALLLALVLAAEVPAVSGDFLNEYFNNKVFGVNPGPCANYGDCTFDYDELSDSVKDQTVCIDESIPAACNKPLRDIVKNGIINVWNLECRQASVSDAQINRISSSSSSIKSEFQATNLKLRCTFLLSVDNLIVQVDGYGKFTADIENLPITFPKSGSGSGAGSLTVNFKNYLNADVQKGETFVDQLAWDIRNPGQECSASTNLEIGGLDSLDDFKYLEVCGNPRLAFTDNVSPNDNLICVKPQNLQDSILGLFFNFDIIVEIIVDLIEGTFASIVCSGLEGLGYLTDQFGVESDGIVNTELKALKADIDEWALAPANDPDTFDATRPPSVSPTRYARSKDFSTDMLWEGLSVALNDWLGAPSTTPGFENSLVVSELIKLVTDLDGRATLELVDLPFDATDISTFDLELKVVKPVVELKRIGLGSLDTVTTFQLLQNALVAGDPLANRLKRTFKNKLRLDSLQIELEMRALLLNGEYSKGPDPPAFDFTTKVDLSDVRIDLSTFMLFDYDNIKNVRMQQITGYGVDEALACVGPAFYSALLSDLELSIGQVNDVSVDNFSGEGLEALLDNSVDLIVDGYSQGFRTKLPGVSRGQLREMVNEDLMVKLRGPCPRFVDPGADYPQRVDLSDSNALTDNALLAFAQSIGGNPIVENGVNVNNIMEVLLNYYVTRYPDGFPYMPTPGGEKGSWRYLNPEVKVTAFEDPFSSVSVGQLQIDNLDSIYKFAFSIASGLKLDFGIGGLLQGQDQSTPRPLRLTLPVAVRLADRGVDEDFQVAIDLSKIQAAIVLTDLRTWPVFQDSLTLDQFLYAQACTIRGYDRITFGSRSIDLDSLDITFTRTRSGSQDPSDPIVAAIQRLADSSSAGTLVEQGGTTESLVRSSVNNIINRFLDDVEALPIQYAGYDASDCSDAPAPFDLDFSNPLTDKTEAAAACMEPAPPLQFPNAVDEEQSLGLDSSDRSLDLNINVGLALLNRLFGAEGLPTVLEALQFLAGRVDFMEEGSNGHLNLVLPLSSFGLLFRDSSIIPGLVADAGTLRILKLDTLLQEMNLFELIGRFTTRYRVKLNDSTEPLRIAIDGFVEVNNAAAGLNNENQYESVRETVRLEFSATEVEMDIELVTAFDPASVYSKTIAHFLSIDKDQQYYVNGLFESCIGSLFAPGGLYVRKFGLNVAQLSDISVRTLTDNLLISQDAETLLSGLAVLVIDFYKDSVPNVCENCIKGFVNDLLKSNLLDLAPRCPVKVDLTAQGKIFKTPEDHLYRFSDNPQWQMVQDVLELARSDGLQRINDIADRTVDGTYLQGPDAFSLVDIPVFYYGKSYGRIDVEFNDLVIDGLQFTDFTVLEPVDQSELYKFQEDIEYTTTTRIDLAGPLTLQVDLELNARGVFPEIPNMVNSIRLGADIDQFKLQSYLMTKANMTDLLRLTLQDVSTPYRLACILIPFKEFVPSKFNLTAAGIALRVQCLDECNFPVLEPLGDLFVAETDNVTEVSELFNSGIKAFLGGLAKVDAQRIIDENVGENSECDSFLEDLDAFFSNREEAEEFEPANVGLGFGMFLISMGLVSAAVFVCSSKQHQKRVRKAALVEAVRNQISEESEMVAIYERVNAKGASPFRHRRTPYAARMLVPFGATISLVFLLAATLLTRVLSGSIVINLLGADTQDVTLIPIDVGSLMETIWESVNPFVAGGFFCAVIIVPLVGNVMLGALWFIPATLLRDATRRSILLWILYTAKYPLILLFLVACIIASVVTSFVLVDFSKLTFLSEGIQLLGFDLRISLQVGATLLTLAVCTTLLCGQIAYYFSERAVMENERNRLNMSGPADERVIKALRKLRDHVFVDGGKIHKRVSKAIVASASFAALLLGLATFSKVLSFEVRGVAGLVLSDAGDSLGASFSLLDLGTILAQSPTSTNLGVVSLYLVVFVYFLTVIFMPIMQMVIIVIAMTVPMTLAQFNITLVIHRASLYWQCFGVCAVGAILTYLIIGPISRSYVNFVSGFIYKDFCEEVRNVLLDLDTIDPNKDAYCLSIEPFIEPGYVLIALAMGVQMATTAVFVALSDHVVNDRRYASLRSVSDKAVLKFPSTYLRRWILKLCTSAKVPEQATRTFGSFDSFKELAQSKLRSKEMVDLMVIADKVARDQERQSSVDRKKMLLGKAPSRPAPGAPQEIQPAGSPRLMRSDSSGSIVSLTRHTSYTGTIPSPRRAAPSPGVARTPSRLAPSPAGSHLTASSPTPFMLQRSASDLSTVPQTPKTGLKQQSCMEEIADGIAKCLCPAEASLTPEASNRPNRSSDDVFALSSNDTSRVQNDKVFWEDISWWEYCCTTSQVFEYVQSDNPMAIDAARNYYASAHHSSSRGSVNV